MWVRNGKRVNPRQKHKKYGGKIFKESLPLCIVSPSAVVIKKSLLDDIGLFDESFKVCEDYDLWLRIAKKYPIGLDQQIGIIKYGGHDDQLSRKYWGMDTYRIMAMEKHIDDKLLASDEYELLLETIIDKLKIIIAGMKKRNKDITSLENKKDYFINKLVQSRKI